MNDFGQYGVNKEVSQIPMDSEDQVFRAPWEGRVFAMATIMAKEETIKWKWFNELLIAEIGAAECKSGAADISEDYYLHWLNAFERTLVERKLLKEDEIQSRIQTLAADYINQHG
ncbi:nitrile hydratase accessory protein [Paenibacillus sp. FSL H7-0326]|uniref:nitrile hydratase accessory protein n=1 Tax=Paenibacillus sp. FSL H7-0326 TaxID=1921144 RepID=UPI00096D6A52|nr:nitrile hydratase accessory protein [Paenibacillus sp. FSL H7-0326]OMC71412.1 nitrile hydratase accessory protein [Paenibacillus sp. FSL H7-0326]